MCGIAGFTGLGSQSDIKKMMDTLIHRGPDGHGLFNDEKHNIWMGHRRLSILDIATGSQPMSSVEEDLMIVFNGEIYNFKELRQELELRGHKFKTSHSDTEVILNGYKEWGENVVDKLNGMWAFCIYDKKKDILFLSRDRFGKKPLYYSLQKGTFAFSSELSSLIQHTSIDNSISKKNLQKYYAYCFIPAPNTLYTDIFKLRAGNNLIVNLHTKRILTETYWRYNVDTNNMNLSEGEICEELTSLLEKAIKRRLVADVPVGVLLSGGIDSSFITALASESGKKQINTYSIGFEDKTFDESYFANIVAKNFATLHHTRNFDLTQYHSFLNDVIAHLDEPMADSSNFPTALLCHETAKQVKVALTGDGADELMCGYDPYKALKLAQLYKRTIPEFLHKGIVRLTDLIPTSHSNISLDFKIKKTLSALQYSKEYWNAIWHGSLAPDQIVEIFNEPIELEELYSEAIESWNHCNSPSIIDKTSQYYIDLFLQDRILTKSDRMSMMYSLELRSPYLDIELVDFLRKIPAKLKFNGTTKYILKKAVAKYLPEEITNRRKKGFGAPVGQWFKDKTLTIPSSIPFLNNSSLKKFEQEHIAGICDHRLFLLNTLFLRPYQKKI